MIDIKNICKSYGKKQVLNNVSTSIERGGVISLIGPNGAGKSTLLSIMSRLDKPTSGSVFLEGKDVHNFDSKLLAQQLAILRQSNFFAVRLTVEELVTLGRFPHSGGNPKKRDKEKVSETISWLELEPMRHRYLDQLSGGQRQRAFVAMVLAQETPYLLLDEPLNNLDLKYARQMMSLVRRIADELERTVIVVLHDINVAIRYSDRIIAMKDGQITASGTPAEVVNSETISEIFDTPVDVTELEGKPLALSF